jgi:hypothetical protein
MLMSILIPPHILRYPVKVILARKAGFIVKDCKLEYKTRMEYSSMHERLKVVY